ncbi:MAG: ABC transporter permease [Deltaproteobacteria bacterium]|nr:MAG: ABC transporter permease [Deltaproteobacteria bacterium]
MQAATASRGRTILTLLAMAIGVSSVILLISLGDSGRRYVIDQFASLGTNLLIVIPGRSETTGGPPPLLGETPRDLTLDDAIALTQSTAIRRVAPIIAGSAPVSVKQLEREMVILGSSADLFEVRRLTMGQGSFLPAGDLDRGGNVCVIGSKGKKELFGNQRALGRWVRIGDRRFRVIGVLADTGVSLGEDMGEVVIIPVATAQSLFNRVSLFRIVVEAISEDAVARAKGAILSIIRARHEGEDDITVITQDAVLATFDKIFRALTMTVGGIAAISLVVAGIMIMNIMLVAISNRRSEIGLLKALGAPQSQIMGLFLTESALLSVAGAFLGFILAFGAMELLAGFFPEYNLALEPWSPFIASGLALGTGIIFGVLPARRASMLQPALALSRR